MKMIPYRNLKNPSGTYHPKGIAIGPIYAPCDFFSYDVKSFSRQIRMYTYCRVNTVKRNGYNILSS